MVVRRRADLLIYLDIGLVGSFVSFVEDGAEDGYVRFKYVPLGTWNTKPILYKRPIRKEHIKSITTTRSEKGVEQRIILIVTGEEGSIVRNILDDENIKLIKKLQDEIKGYKKQIASTRQEASDAQSGVAKSIEKMNTMKKSANPSGGINPFSTFGNRDIPSFGGDDYNE